jgi:hypothetical protein
MSFGTSNRDFGNKSMGNPGPGNYIIPGKGIEGPKFTMRPKTDKVPSSEKPGPGAYEAVGDDKLYPNLPNCKIGTSRRYESKNIDVPGPG